VDRSFPDLIIVQSPLNSLPAPQPIYRQPAPAVMAQRQTGPPAKRLAGIDLRMFVVFFELPLAAVAILSVPNPAADDHV
jgi:hypothetical protein